MSSTDRQYTTWGQGTQTRACRVVENWSTAGPVVGNLPRITFGIIVLNGEPFVRRNLCSLYPFAHEIIVVEGASRNAAQVATATGHSLDGTLDVLRRFKAKDDPENKLTIVIAEDHGYSDGFWPGEKDEQSAAYAQRASGDVLWQIDVDEFYHGEDVLRLMAILADRPELSGVSFHWKNFWGGFDYLVDGWDYRDLVENMGGIRRVFRWRAGYHYASHRPPTVIDDKGQDLFEKNWLSSDETARLGIFCYHYGMVLATQAKQKSIYYRNLLPECDDMQQWYQDTFLELRYPFNILHGTNPPSWLVRFKGIHPKAIRSLIHDNTRNVVNLEQRPTADIEFLLVSWRYRIATFLLHYLYSIVPPLRRVLRRAWDRIRPLLIPPLVRVIIRQTKTALYRWLSNVVITRRTSE